MISKSFRAAAAALLIGSATVVVSAVALTAPAQAAAARAAVAGPLKEAISAASSGNFSAARSAVARAENVSNLTPGDRAAIEQVKNYVEAKSGATSGKGGMATLYNQNKYSEVIALGRKGGLDPQSEQLVAQSYYLTRDFKSCTQYVRDHFGAGASEQILQLQQRCAYESGDNEGQRTALELLVQRTNKPEYWSQLLQAAEGTKGLTDHETLDIYRLKLMTGSLKTADDYMLLAQLALQMGFGAESQAVIKKGTDAKLLSGNRVDRLMGMATSQASTNNAGAAKAQAGNGEALVKYGEDISSQQGRGPDAVKAVQAGIAKSVTDKANAQTRLGQAYLAAGQKDQAIHAFATAGAAGDPRAKVVAHLWEIYARTH